MLSLITSPSFANHRTARPQPHNENNKDTYFVFTLMSFKGET